MKIISKIIFLILIVIILLGTYLSIFGIETSKFNKQIQNQVKGINNNLSLELKKVKLVLDPIRFNFSAKTLGPKIINQNEYLELENIKTSISLKSLISNVFSIEQLEISTKSIEISNLISFVRLIYETPELIVFEKLFNVKGYMIANIKVEFDKNGNLKDNYIFSGFIKDTKANLTKDFSISKLNLNFDIRKDNINFKNLNVRLNNINLDSNSIYAQKIKNGYKVKGNLKNDLIELDAKDFIFFKKIFFTDIDIKKFKFNSKNNFTFKINDKFQLKDTTISSKVNLKEARISKNVNLKDIFPEFENDISFFDHEIDLEYKKDFLSINGNGKILIQKLDDIISYKIRKDQNKFEFEKIFKTKKNPFLLKLLNYEKKNSTETIIKLNGHRNKKDKIYIQSASLVEEKNKIEIKDIYFDKNLKIEKFENINLNYIDKDNKRNSIKIYRNKKKYALKGDYFNADNLINNILFAHKETIYFSEDFDINLDIKKVFLDKKFQIENLNGNLYFKNKQLSNGNLIGYFSENKKMVFTVRNSDNKKITTFFVDHAEPFIKRYKFIKGFDEGVLDFYSSRIDNISNSTLKIYDFKLKELPTLTKILTLASLQGIADILSGEGIRFNEFEMNFKNEGNLMKIDEIYALGPAISILMSGYIEKNKIVSLRGTLVPATTINKAIGTIPVLGKILVGNKTGEGVFGVSFKIKGPPKDLETTVNPIKTLTPRFITRTLEKIKKTN